jgi:hypothetical protein
VRIIDILKSSRQMMFENALEGFEYTGRGTCFLCRYRGVDFAVTAKHVIRGYSPDQIRIAFHQSSRSFAPHNSQVTIADAGFEDTDWADLAIFPLERSHYDDTAFGEEPPYLIPASSALWRPPHGGHFIMRGFPHDLNAIDYDRAVIRQQAVQIEADHVAASSMAHCHEIAFRDISMCTTLDGLSGTPVFWLGAGPPHEHRLAGVLVRATHSSGRGHFIHASVLVTALDKTLDG